MTLRDYLRVLREQWLVVLVAVVLALAGATAAFMLRPPKYTAKLQLYVSTQFGDTPQAAFQGAQLSEQRVKSYTELLTSQRVAGEVAGRLGLDESPEDLVKQISATSALDSVLIDVAVTDTSPARAAQLVNAIGDVFPDLVDQIERPTTRTGVAQVAVRVVEPASVPTLPSSTGLPVTLALGLLAGLAVGVGGALARNALDTSVKSPHQLRDAAGASNLGFVAYDPQVPKRPLTVHEDPHSPRAEAFRQLRTNLQFANVDDPPRIIALTSAVSGEGKTTTLANLAIALGLAGGRVLVVEADLRRPKLAAYLGLEGAVGLSSVLTGRVQLEQALQPWGDHMFDVLTSGPLPPNPSEMLSSQHMRALLAQLRESYDQVLLDTPPLLPVTDAAAVAPLTDGVILVCRHGHTTRSQVHQAAEGLDAVGARVLGTVLTMVANSGLRAYGQYNPYYRADTPTDPNPSVNGSAAAHAQPRPDPSGTDDVAISTE